MRFQREQDILIIGLEGELDFSNSSDVKNEIRKNLMESDRHIILDLIALTFADSSGIGVIISLAKVPMGQGGTLSLIRPSEKIRFVLEMTKIDQVIPIYPDLMTAKMEIDHFNSKHSG